MINRFFKSELQQGFENQKVKKKCQWKKKEITQEKVSKAQKNAQRNMAIKNGNLRKVPRNI